MILYLNYLVDIKKMKIIILPFAGGNKHSFNFLKDKLFREGLSIDVFEYTVNREDCQKTFLSINELLNELFSKLIEIIKDEDYVIYGHSMGALVGYLICQKIEELGFKKPQKLIVSGKKSPCIEREIKIAHLPDEKFWQEVVKLGGIPDELQNHPELIEFCTPILKADFTVVENYQYEKKEKLTIPINVFYGSEETIEEEMLGWKDETTAEVTITKMEGNHFFIYNHVDFFVNLFKKSFIKS